jgi:hypothetical protein
LKFLEERFKANKIKKESHKNHVKNAVRLAFFDEKIISPEKLAGRLGKEGVHLVLRKSKDGQLYGVTYVDNITHSVFNGSSLGKQYSAKGILESCELNISHHKKHYQKSNISSSENIQNLESNHSKINPIDILLRAENTNDYVPRQFKQKKRPRIRRGI